MPKVRREEFRRDGGYYHLTTDDFWFLAAYAEGEASPEQMDLIEKDLIERFPEATEFMNFWTVASEELIESVTGKRPQRNPRRRRR